MQKIAAYKIEDGRVFEDEVQAMQAENEIIQKSNLEKLVETYGWNGMDRDEVVSMLLDHRKEFKKNL